MFFNFGSHEKIYFCMNILLKMTGQSIAMIMNCRFDCRRELVCAAFFKVGIKMKLVSVRDMYELFYRLIPFITTLLDYKLKELMNHLVIMRLVQMYMKNIDYDIIGIF